MVRTIRKMGKFIAWLCVAMLCPLDVAQAIGIGPLSVSSGLGQPLRAKVELVGEGSSDWSSSCFKARVETIDGAYIGTPKVILSQDMGSPIVDIRLDKSITEPGIVVILDFTCSPRMHRVYQALLNLPTGSPTIEERQAAPTVPIYEPRLSHESSRSNSDHKNKQHRRRSRRDAGKSKAVPKAAAKSNEPLSTAGSLQRPDEDRGSSTSTPAASREERLDTHVSEIQQQPKNPDGLSLQVSRNLSADTTSAQEKALTPPVVTPASPSQPSAVSSAEDERLRQETARIEHEKEAEARVEHEKEARLAHDARSKQQVAAEPAQSEPLPPIPFATASHAPTEIVKTGGGEGFFEYMVPILGAIALFVIGGGAFFVYRLKRMRARLSTEDATQKWEAIAQMAQASTIAQTEIDPLDQLDAPFPPPKPAPAQPQLKAVRSVEPNKPESEIPLSNRKPDADPLKSAQFVTKSVVVEKFVKLKSQNTVASLKVEEISDVAMEAEFWMSINDSQRALEILEPQADVERPESPVPWLFLLDIYRDTRNQAKFNALRDRFERIFNAKIPAFDVVVPEQANHSLEEFPNLMQRICAVWRTPDAIGFMGNLLADDRNGGRAGFDLQVYREILMLINVLRELARLPVPDEFVEASMPMGNTLDFDSIDFTRVDFSGTH